jgi:hypothetical protein
MGKTGFRRLARDVDNPPAAPLLHHHIRRRPQPEKRAGQINVDHFRLILRRHRHHRFHDAANTGILHSYVQRAMRRHRVAGEHPHLTPISNITHAG